MIRKIICNCPNQYSFHFQCVEIPEIGWIMLMLKICWNLVWICKYMYRLNSWFRNSVQMNMLKRNINFECDRKFCMIFLKIACRFFFLYFFSVHFKIKLAVCQSYRRCPNYYFFCSCLCRRWHLLVSMVSFLFLAKIFSDAAKNDAWSFLLLLFDFMWIEAGTVSFRLQHKI